MFDGNDYCEQCHEAVDPKVGLYELGKMLVCKTCWQRKEESLEREEKFRAKTERVFGYDVNNEERRRKT